MYFMVDSLFAITITNVILNFLPPVMIVVSGYALSYFLYKRFDERNLIDKWLISLLIGVSVIVFPSVALFSALNGSRLRDLYIYLTIFLVVLTCFVIIRYRRKLWRGMLDSFCIIRTFAKDDVLAKALILSYFMLCIKIIFTLSIGPINDADPLTQYLPYAKILANYDSITSYKVQYPSTGIGTIGLYSWSFAIFNFSVEPFRLIPIIFMLSWPLLIYAITKHFTNKKYALIAALLSCFSPFFDDRISYSFYPDISSATFVILSIYFMSRKIAEENHGRLNDIIIGVALALAFYLKDALGYVGFIILFVMASKAFIRNRFLASIIVFASAFACFLYPALLYNLFDPWQSVAIIGLAIVVVLYGMPIFERDVKSVPYSKLGFRKILEGFIPLLITASLCLPWIIMQSLRGVAPLWILLSGSSELLRQFWLPIVPQSAFILGRYDVFMLFWHPSLAVYLSTVVLIGLILSFFNAQTRKVSFIFLLSYLIFFTLFAYGITYRYLLIASFFIPIIGSFGILAVLNTYVRDKIMPATVFLFTFPFLVFSVFQHRILARADLGFVKYLRITDYNAGRFSEVTNLDTAIFLGIIFVLLLPALVFAIKPKLKSSHFFSKRPQIETSVKNKQVIVTARFKQTCVSGLLCGLFFLMLVAPSIINAWTETNGNLLAFPYEGSNYKESLNVAYALNRITTENDTILTFLYETPYHLNAGSIGLSSLMMFNAVTANDTQTILEVFHQYNITYVMIPSAGNWVYNTFEAFCQKSSMLQLLYDNGHLLPIISHNDVTNQYVHDVYKIIYGNEISYLKMDGVCSGAANAYYYHTISKMEYTIESGDKLEYWVMIPRRANSIINPEFKAGVDISFSDGTNLSQSNAADQNGLDAGPLASIFQEVRKDGITTNVGLWYHRIISFPTGLVGKTLSHVDVAFEGDAPGIYETYFGPIRILSDSGRQTSVAFESGGLDLSKLDKSSAYSGVTIRSLYPPIENEEPSVSLLNPTKVSTCESVTNWHPQYYLSDEDVNLLVDGIDYVEGSASLRIQGSNILSQGAISASYYSIYPQDWTNIRYVSLWFKMDSKSDDVHTLYFFIRDTSGNWLRYSASYATANSWQQIFFALENPSSTSPTKLDFAHVIEFDIQVRNFGLANNPALTFWFDDILISQEMRLGTK
jgi:hypothetical protein